jgi:myo-inositol-1(or 4)-monophosphatase
VTDAPPVADLAQAVERAAGLAVEMRGRFTLGHKPDGSLVTSADRAVEEVLRAELESLAPGAGFWGEERGFEPDTEAGLWLVDPIDGTSNYVFGQPLWGVSVGFYRAGTVRLGAVCMPGLGLTLTGDAEGAWIGAEALERVVPGPIAAHELVGLNDTARRTFPDLPGKRRDIGAFVVEAAWVATGKLRAMANARCSLYDMAGSLPALRAVGLEIVHADGSKFDESRWIRAGLLAPFIVRPPLG